MATLNRKLISLVLLLISHLTTAQDVQFSQIYANPLYQNPAFAGSAHATRLTLHQRIQWPDLDAKYVTSFLSADHYFERSRSGVGLMFLRDWQGARNISSSEVSGQYSYQLPVSHMFSIRAGLQGSYISRYINYNALTFPDQYTSKGFNHQLTNEDFGSDKVNFVDISAGLVFYSDEFWIGFASHHINSPNQSFYGGISNLPTKIAFTGGYRFTVREKFNPRGEQINVLTVTPTFHYKLQEKSDQMDFGLYALYHQVILGAWYRGIPLKTYNTRLHNNESIAILAGYKFNNLSISYSYDFTVSQLTRATTFGAHELNITYLFDWPPRKKKPMRRLPCPDFNR